MTTTPFGVSRGVGDGATIGEMVDLWDADAVQREVYERAGLPPDEPASLVTLAHALGLTVETLRPAPFPGDGALVRVHDSWRIYLRGGIPRERKRFALAHELAEWSMRDVVDEHLEDACNAIAAALIAPRRAFARQLGAVGHDWAQLALPFGMTQTSAALRAGEAHRVPLAVVARVVRTRGPEAFVWPDESTLRRWARAAPAGLARARLTDDPARVVLVAEDVG